VPSLARALVSGLTFATCACAAIAGIDDFQAASTLDQTGGHPFDGSTDDEASTDGSFKSDALGLQLPDGGDASVSDDASGRAGCGANAQPCCVTGAACNAGLVCGKDGVCGGLPSGCACIDTSCPAGEYCLNGQYCLKPGAVPPGWTACNPSAPPDGCSFEGHAWCLNLFGGQGACTSLHETTCTSVTTGMCGSDYGCKYRLD
jgi:hypothetical protein